MKRWHRILVRVLVVAQLLATAPLASALPSAERADATPCAGIMDMSSLPDSKPCPCCPDDMSSLAGCLSACIAAVGMTPAFNLPLILAETPRPGMDAVIAHFRASDPPTKPPPIA